MRGTWSFNNDGRFAYVWDGENRLIVMTNNTGVGPKYGLTFAYDPKGRRIQKLVATNGIAISTNKFLYDGWNLVAELKPDNTRLRTYVWGTDLSGSLQGAGGVGGLLEESYYGTSTTNCFPAYDGNGNIMALANAADGTVAANYDYGAFGEPIRITGAMARNNPFRFSTKYADDESDLIYYGYRYYKPSTGTWLSKDPIEEQGGLNLYCLVGNNPVKCIDYLGEQFYEPPILPPDNWPGSAIGPCSYDLTYDFGSKWTIAIHPNSMRDIKVDLIKRFIGKKYDPSGDCCKGFCIGSIKIAAHGAGAGIIPLSNDMSDYFDPGYNPVLWPGKPLGPSQLRYLRAVSLFRQIKAKMCKKGVIYFPVCKSGTPDLQRALEAIFGPDIDVVTYQDDVVVGVPGTPPIGLPPGWPL